MTSYVGVSKYRLMAGSSTYCAVCQKVLRRPFDNPHTCVAHGDWVLAVIDGEQAVGRYYGQQWEEEDVGAGGGSC